MRVAVAVAAVQGAKATASAAAAAAVARACGWVHHASGAADAHDALRARWQHTSHGDGAVLLLLNAQYLRKQADLRGQAAALRGSTYSAQAWGARLSSPPPAVPYSGWLEVTLALMPMCFSRASSRAFRSAKGTIGRATSEVSSRKSFVGEKGIAYRNVGSLRERGVGRWA